MRVAFYPAFRPLDHSHSSGLVSIARDISQSLQAQGHEVILPLRQSMEWIYRRPQCWPQTCRELWQANQQLHRHRPDCWLTYHSYYRGPDIPGPLLSRHHHLPYCIFAGSYATKYRKQWKTWLGFHLNRRALTRAEMVFVNKKRDQDNLRRLLPQERLCYIRPGIDTALFPLDLQCRSHMRTTLQIQDRLVIVTAAMMRPGIKSEGLALVIEACSHLLPAFPSLHLLLIGDGPQREQLEQLAAAKLPRAHSFTGWIAPAQLHRFYLAGDLFAFPGIRESLGMVYLEAQCSGLPIVATSHDGAPEVVVHGETGIIVPPFSLRDFTGALFTLLRDKELRDRFSRQARKRILRDFDRSANYQKMFGIMELICARGQQ